MDERTDPSTRTYYEAMASKDGQTEKVTVDAQTGRLRGNDDEDDDD